MLASEPLLLATIFGVLLGILAGSLLRLGKLSSKTIDLIGKSHSETCTDERSACPHLSCPMWLVTL